MLSAASPVACATRILRVGLHGFQTRFSPCSANSAPETHLSLQLQDPHPGHPQVAQRRQHRRAQRVLPQPAVAHLGIAKLLFDHPEWVLDLGPHAGLQSLGFLRQFVQFSP